ncbi:MAG UNVERIFIED_CONTAM: transglutaminase-like cysteine peptidase, partial [Methylobacterium ajmalii]
MRIAGRKNEIGRAALAAVALLASVTGAGSQTLAALPAVTIPAAPVGEARPVPAWTEFCARYASECAVNPNEPAQVTLTPRLWQTVTTINRQVNTSLRAVTDQE